MQSQVSNTGFSVRLIPAITPGALPLAKLAPERNSLRLATAAAAKPTSTAKGQKRKREGDAAALITKGDAFDAGARGGVDASRLPTPQYNTGIIADMSMEGHQQVLQSAFEAVPRLREAVVLLKVLLSCITLCATKSQATGHCRKQPELGLKWLQT